MSSNPYVVPNIVDGFQSGLQMVWGQQKAQQEQAAAAREQKAFEYKTATQPTIAQAQQANVLGIQAAQAGVEKTQAETSETAKRGDFYTAHGNWFNAEANRANWQVRQEKDYAKAAGAKALLDKAPDVSKLVQDPQWLQDSESVDAFVNHGMVPQGQDPSTIKDTASRWLQKTYDSYIQKGVNETIDPTTAKAENIPVGSKIMHKQVADFHVDPATGDVVLGLRVTVQTPNGDSATYMAPMTEGRTSGPKDNIKHIPMSDVQRMATGAGHVAQAAKIMGDKGFTPQQVADHIDASIAAATKQSKPYSGPKFSWTPDGMLNKQTGVITPRPNNISPKDWMNAAVKLETSKNFDPDTESDATVMQKLHSLAGVPYTAEAGGALPTIDNEDAWKALSPGTRYQAPDGNVYIKSK